MNAGRRDQHGTPVAPISFRYFEIDPILIRLEVHKHIL
jgi:hypothetical protein